MYQKIKAFLFTNTSDKQTVVKNTVWLALGEFGTRFLKLGLFAYSARKLGVHEWGVFSYALILMGIFSILSDMGVNTITTREVSKKTEERQKYIATSFFIKLLLSIGGVLTLSIASLFVQNKEIAQLIPIICIFLFLDSIREYGFAVVRAFEKMEQEAKTKLFSTLSLLISAVVILLYFTNAKGLFWAYITAAVVGLFFLISEKRTLAITLKNNIDIKLIVPILQSSWPIGIVAMLTVIFSTTDTLLLGFFRNPEEVGYYSAAQKPLQLLALLPTLAVTALLPIFSRLTQTAGGLKNIFNRTFSVALLIIIPITTLVIAFSTPIIRILFGPHYLPSAPLLQITAISVLASTVSIFIINALISYGKQKQTIIFAAVGASANILLSFLLIPRWGMYGAALAFTLTQFCMSIFILFYTRNIPDLSILPNFKRAKKDITSIFS